MSESRRLRFSLATLLLVTTIAAMGITIFLLMREIGPLRAEVKKLRVETGRLWIEDETKIHAIRIPEHDAKVDVDRYRVYLPPGKHYRLCYATNNIPVDGIPAVHGNFNLDGGELVVSIQLQFLKDEKTREPIPSASLHIRLVATSPNTGPSGGATVGFDEQDYKWMDYRKAEKYRLIISSNPPGQSYASPADQPLVLQRARISEQVVLNRDSKGKPNSWTSKHIAEPTDGYIVWIEPVK